MQKIRLVIFFLLFSTILFSQDKIMIPPDDVEGSLYYLELSNKMGCSLHFFDDAHYEISLCYNCPNTNSSIITLSCGTCIHKDETSVILSDECVLKSKIELKRLGDRLIVLSNKFRCLTGKTFKYVLPPDFPLPGDEYDYYVCSCIQREKKSTDRRIHKIYYDSYSSFCGSKLQLLKPNVFRYYFHSALLLEGTFEKKGNLLVLSDQTAKCELVFEVTDKGIIDTFCTDFNDEGSKLVR